MQPLVRDHGAVNEVCAIVVILLCPLVSSGFLLLLHVLSAGTKYRLLPGEKPCGRALPCRSRCCDRCGLKPCRDLVLLRKTSSSARAGRQCSVFSKHESIDREKGPTRSSRCPEVTLPLPDSSPPRVRSQLSPLLGAGPRQPQQSPTLRLVAAPKRTPEENRGRKPSAEVCSHYTSLRTSDGEYLEVHKFKEGESCCPSQGAPQSPPKHCLLGGNVFSSDAEIQI